MKSLVQLVLAAIMGSVITLGAYSYLQPKTNVVHVNEQSSTSTPAALTKTNSFGNGTSFPNSAKPFASTSKGIAAPVDFTAAAASTTNAVVHIKSTQKIVAARNPYGGGGQDFFNPFREFFGDDLFFGNPGQPRQQKPNAATGSGVIISSDGYIVTNNHVIDNASELEVTLHDQRSYKATLVGTDPSTDIALLKIDEADLPKIQMANSDKVRVGEWVLAVGNPFNLASTVTAGIISATGRNINIFEDRSAIESFIQTDAAVNPGNSGGALVNTEGYLIGINTAIATPTGTYAGYSFAVPTNIVEKVVDDLMNHGIVQRAYLGVMIRNLDSKLAEELDINLNQGVYVDSLLSDGSAAMAGIKKGDVIVSIDENEVNTTSQLQERVGRQRPGDDMIVGLVRNGNKKDINVTLRNKMGNTKVVTKDAVTASKTFLLERLGVELQDLPKEDLKKMRLNSGVQVTSIAKGLIRDNTDMQEGFIITGIDRQAVKSAEEVKDILSKKKGGVMVEGVYPDYPGNYFYAFGL